MSSNIPGEKESMVDYILKDGSTQRMLPTQKYILFIQTHVENNSMVDFIDIGTLLLSPTRTYLPVLKQILAEHHSHINGMIHCISRIRRII